MINLADQLLAQLDAKDDLAPTSATVPEEAVSLSGNVSPKDSHHEHHSSLGEKIKGLGHDVKEAVKEVGTAGDRRPNRQQARKVSIHSLIAPRRSDRMASALRQHVHELTMAPLVSSAAAQAERDRRGAGCGPG